MLGGELVNSVGIQTETMVPAQYSVGDGLWIMGLDGFPEARLTMGVVRGVKHTLGGTTLNLTHDITIDVDETQEELAA
jgi:hypothetical protein